jgi:hypothetical protein
MWIVQSLKMYYMPYDWTEHPFFGFSLRCVWGGRGGENREVERDGGGKENYEKSGEGEERGSYLTEGTYT